MYANLLPNFIATDACLYYCNTENIEVSNTTCIIMQNIVDYLHSGWLNLFGSLKSNCTNILITFIRFAKHQAVSYLLNYNM